MVILQTTIKRGQILTQQEKVSSPHVAEAAARLCWKAWGHRGKLTFLPFGLMQILSSKPQSESVHWFCSCLKKKK